MEGSIAQDISPYGLKLRVNTCIPQNTILNLQISIPGQVQFVPAQAKVVWIRELPFRDDGWEIGLQLTTKVSSPSIEDYIGFHSFGSNSN